ncbi:MAG: hypothetical protein KJ737_27570 [Proteobacteria bacterium]|nr:hypothetical protein [Pseudomonadota bacterium]
MRKRYSRKLSYNERLYIAGEGITPPAANQFVFDGSGVLDSEKWKSAVKEASRANPGSRLILKGFLGSSRWIDSGQTPPVREIECKNWNDKEPLDASFIKDILPVKKGPTCEVVLVHGNPLRVVFRTHHSVMDGRGTFIWIEDIFRALKGDPLLGSDSDLTDTELARSFQKEFRKPFAFDNLAPTGKAKGNDRGITWRKMNFSGRFYNLVGQLAILSAKEAWRHAEGKFRLSLPVDMRHHSKGIRSTGNLTMPIYLEITKDTRPEHITRNISHMLRDGAEGMIEKNDPLLRFIPIRTIRAHWKKIVNECHQKGLYRTSGLISNLGLIPLNFFSGGGFRSESFWTVPPSYDNIPFFLGLAALGNNHFSIMVSMPKVLASDGRIDAFMEKIISGLEKAPEE